MLLVFKEVMVIFFCRYNSIVGIDNKFHNAVYQLHEHGLKLCKNKYYPKFLQSTEYYTLEIQRTLLFLFTVIVIYNFRRENIAHSLGLSSLHIVWCFSQLPSLQDSINVLLSKNDQVTYAFNYNFIIKLLEFYWDLFSIFGLYLTKYSFKYNSRLSSKSPWLFFLLQL